LVIANATGNRYFADIMSHLGATLIPAHAHQFVARGAGGSAAVPAARSTASMKRFTRRSRGGTRSRPAPPCAST
jgi:hypothetical protein